MRCRRGHDDNLCRRTHANTRKHTQTRPPQTPKHPHPRSQRDSGAAQKALLGERLSELEMAAAAREGELRRAREQLAQLEVPAALRVCVCVCVCVCPC
jgi:hypothetical protein